MGREIKEGTVHGKHGHSYSVLGDSFLITHPQWSYVYDFAAEDVLKIAEGLTKEKERFTRLAGVSNMKPGVYQYLWRDNTTGREFWSPNKDKQPDEEWHASYDSMGTSHVIGNDTIREA